jgi:hypothetical protein
VPHDARLQVCTDRDLATFVPLQDAAKQPAWLSRDEACVYFWLEEACPRRSVHPPSARASERMRFWVLSALCGRVKLPTLHAFTDRVRGTAAALSQPPVLQMVEPWFEMPVEWVPPDKSFAALVVTPCVRASAV